MKTTTRLLGTTVAMLVLGMALSGHAALYPFTDNGGSSFTASASTLGKVIPDNDPVGVAYALNFSQSGLQITDISFTFRIDGGWNGDMYAYLSHGSGFAVLLNRVGTVNSGDDGFSTSGFNNITLSMTGANDIHMEPSPTSEGAYAADGRPDYYEGTRNNTLSVFNNADPYGSWTLFFADTAAGSEGTLDSWSLDITAVPEPVNVALGVCGGVFAVVILARTRRVRSRLHQWWVAVVRWIDAV